MFHLISCCWWPTILRSSDSDRVSPLSNLNKDHCNELGNQVSLRRWWPSAAYQYLESTQGSLKVFLHSWLETQRYCSGFYLKKWRPVFSSRINLQRRCVSQCNGNMMMTMESLRGFQYFAKWQWSTSWKCSSCYKYFASVQLVTWWQGDAGRL